MHRVTRRLNVVWLFYITFNWFIFIKMRLLHSWHLFRSLYNTSYITYVHFERALERYSLISHWLTYGSFYTLFARHFLQERNPDVSRDYLYRLYIAHFALYYIACTKYNVTLDTLAAVRLTAAKCICDGHRFDRYCECFHSQHSVWLVIAARVIVW
jgi:hypothetical protein